MCTSFYLGALQGGDAHGQSRWARTCRSMPSCSTRASRRMEQELFDGEYFIQKIQWKGLRAKSPLEVQSMVGGYSPEALELLEKEGPKYQYGTGCLSDGVLGAWLALVCGVGPGGSTPKKIASHLKAVHKYNLKRDLTAHANPQRPSYACGAEGGLLLCTWPKGGKLSLPFVYSRRGLDRHRIPGGLAPDADGPGGGRPRDRARLPRPLRRPGAQSVQRIRVRPLVRPGHVELRVCSRASAAPATTPWRRSSTCRQRIQGDFRCFLSTATGYGTVGVKRRQAVRRGEIRQDRGEGDQARACHSGKNHLKPERRDS